MAQAHPPHPRQQRLPMDMPAQAPEGRMRELFDQQWSRWHRCKRYEDAVADPVTRRLLELAVLHGARHALGPRRRR